MFKFSVIFIILSMNIAYAVCKLNIRGDSICTNEKALQFHYNEDKSLSYKIVKVKDISYYPKVLAETLDGKEVETHVDDLSGNQLCEASDYVCRSQKVVLDQECTDTRSDKTYKVENVFSLDLIEVKEGVFLFKKAALYPVTCIVEIVD